MVFRRLAANVLISALQMTPTFVYYYFCFPGEIQIVAYSMLVFPSPLLVPLYYRIYRRVLGMPQTTSLMFMEWLILGQYLSMLIYLTASSFWSTAVSGTMPHSYLHISDIIAMASTAVIVWSMWFPLRALVRRTGHFLPSLNGDVPKERVVKGMSTACLSIIMNYMLLVFCNISLAVIPRPNMDAQMIWTFALMLVLQGYRLIDQYQSKRINVLEWQRSAAESYTDSLMRTLDELRNIKHDFSNILQVYGGYISARDLDGLRDYHQDLAGEMQHLSADTQLLEALRPRAAVYNLLAAKQHSAKLHGLSFEFGAVGPLRDIALGDIDLCRILGNLLDNAIEAAAESDQRSIALECRRESIPAVTVTLANTTGKQPDAARLFDHGYTTKPGHSGRGLCIVRDLLLDRDCGNLHTEQDAQTFIAHLQLWTTA